MSLPGFTADSALNATVGGQVRTGRPLGAGVTPALVGRWGIPWTSCYVICAEVCTRYCSDASCCKSETRCGVSCTEPTGAIGDRAAAG